MPGALETRFPGLRHGRLALGQLPVPVDELVGLPVGRGVRVFCKREDRSGAVYGGNKVRKLEFLLAQALDERRPVDGGRSGLLTFGAVGSHHVLATCLYGNQVGLPTHAVLVAHPDSPHTRDNARIIAGLAASTWPAASMATAPVAAMRALAWLGLARRPVVIPPGGSSPVGALGAVDLGLEIGQDVQDGRMPPPDRVVVALGSGGTAAGLLVGLRLAGLAAEVVAVRVVARAVGNLTTVRRLARQTAALLPEALLPEALRPQACALHGLRVVHDAAGAGYGAPLRQGVTAEAIARWCAGVQLEQTYTAKAFAACLVEARRAPPGTVLLFVNTLNSRPLEGLLAASPDTLPPSLEALLL